MASLLKKCIFGPPLYRIHRHRGRNGEFYSPNLIEFSSDKVLKTISVCWSITCWLSPVVAIILYRRGYISYDGAGSLARFTFTIGLIYTGAMLLRGIGRFTNPDYLNFIQTLERAIRNNNSTDLLKYDCDLSVWPVSFSATSSPRDPTGQEDRTLCVNILPRAMYKLRSAIGWCLIHSFGRSMIYPGSTSLLNAIVAYTLTEYRGKLIEEKRAIRAKITTINGNYLDTVFVDRRGSSSRNGAFLVIVCEGNAGFYEMGSMGAPTDAGYSVLGWNRPGFGASSGLPYLDAEHRAADAVMQYALNFLGFTPDNVILFAWSIGGYDAAYLASLYPDVKCLILDATFDDILPLAVSKMPDSASGIIEDAIRIHMNLDIASLVLQYPGPVRLIRRSRDEMITIGPTVPLDSNRGNFLLIKLLTHRYPNLTKDEVDMEVLRRYVSVSTNQQRVLLTNYGLQDQQRPTALSSFISQSNSRTFPAYIGDTLDDIERHQILLYLASKHTSDFDATHCTPLPKEMFREAWDFYDTDQNVN